MTRPNWDEYFMGFALAAAKRGTCDRKHVGAVIVVNKQVVATGYNGSVQSMPHCDDVGHDMVDGHCVRTIHAEMNALAQAAKHGVAVDGARIYTTASPCWDCFRVLVNAGVLRFIYLESYREIESRDRIQRVCRETGVDVTHLSSMAGQETPLSISKQIQMMVKEDR
jgi:dCMP deaminase